MVTYWVCITGSFLTEPPRTPRARSRLVCVRSGYTLNRHTAVLHLNPPDLCRVVFRLVNLMFAAVFGASAVLQYNDEAGLAWAALYFVGTCVCLQGEEVVDGGVYRYENV